MTETVFDVTLIDGTAFIARTMSVSASGVLAAERDDDGSNALYGPAAWAIVRTLERRKG
jgi:hypothetical protein